MNARTDFSELRSVALAHQMGAKLSQPATRVEADAPMTTMRFARTLDERNPYTRSGSAWIIPMDDTLQSEFNASTYVLGFILAAVVIAVCWGAA